MVSSQLVHGQLTVSLLGKVSFSSLQTNEHAKATDVEASAGNAHKNIDPKVMRLLPNIYWLILGRIFKSY